MKAEGTKVILLCVVLHCVQPTPQSSCVQENSCESFRDKNYCKANEEEPAGNYCKVIEVHLGKQNFETIYLHCCDKEQSISRKWSWKPLDSPDSTAETMSWQPLDHTSETISFDEISNRQMGIYRCVIQHSNKPIDVREFNVTQIICIQGYIKPEVKFPEDGLVRVGQPFTSDSFHVKFGCDATARHISIQFYKEGIPIKLRNVSINLEQGCVRDAVRRDISLVSLTRRCEGTISLPEVTQTDIGMKISITVSACYNGEVQEVTGNFSILNAEIHRQVAGHVDTKLILSLAIGVPGLLFLLCALAYRLKLHVWLLSRMCFYRCKIVDAKQVHILHCDDETCVFLANNLRDWITREYTLLRVICSCDLKGRGVLIGEIDAIKESDFVIVIPSSSTADNVYENLFNSMVQHINYWMITIIETSALKKQTCSISKNKIFKRLKHVNIKSCSNEDIDQSGLRERLGNCDSRRNSGDIGHICCPCSTSRNLQRYQPGYRQLDLYRFPFHTSQTCNGTLGIGGLSTGGCNDYDTYSEMTGKENCAPSIINTQQSKRILHNSLKLSVPTGSCSETEVTSSYNAESPDTATTYLSPDLQCKTVPFNNIDVN